MKNINKLISIVTVLNFVQSHAAVNMKTASFNQTWVDITLNNQSPLLIERKYNSRSLYRGIFGLGWCSNIENIIQKIDVGTLIYKDCANFMKPKTFKINKTNKLIKEYTNKNNRIERIIELNGLYTYYKSNNLILKFNKLGKLIQINKKNSYIYSLEYSNNLISSINDGNSSLHLSYNKYLHLVKKIQHSKGLVAQYQYKGLNLVNSINFKNEKVNYSYSDTNNLVSITGKFNTTIDYNDVLDQVERINVKTNCYRSFKFKKLTDLINQSIAVTICKNRSPKTVTYEFHHKKVNENRRLNKVFRNDGSKNITIINNELRKISGQQSEEI